MIFSRFGRFVLEFLHEPFKVLWLCIGFGILSIVLNGSILQLWGLHQQRQVLQSEISQMKSRKADMALKIREAQHPEFIERQARDQLDLVSEGDLIFVFPESSSSPR